MKVHVREDTSGLGAASALSGSGGSSLSSLYSEMGHFSNQQNLAAGLNPSNHPHTDLDSHGQDLSSQQMDADSENDCSSEIPEIEFDIKEEGGRSRTPSAASSSAPPMYQQSSEHKTPSPPSPTTLIGNVSGSGGGSSSGTANASSHGARSHPSPSEDQSCSAMSLKESYHISSNIKK